MGRQVSQNVMVWDERVMIQKYLERADVRYLYIPVGGSKNVAAATLLVFTFVALWHDLSFRLLAWGWLVSLFVLPEIAARATFPFEKVSQVYFVANRTVWPQALVPSSCRNRRGHEPLSPHDCQFGRFCPWC
jgi:hypothetical protein